MLAGSQSLPIASEHRDFLRGLIEILSAAINISDFIHFSVLNEILFSSTATDSKRCGRDCCHMVKAVLDLIVATFRMGAAYSELLCLERVGW